MALPGGVNRIDDVVNALVPSLPAGARLPRADRIFGRRACPTPG